MRCLRKLAAEFNEFEFTFGCASHALHNLGMNWAKESGPKMAIKNAVFILHGVRSTHLIIALFDKLCMQKYGLIYSLISFTKMRWSTVYYMFAKLIRVKIVLTSMPAAVAHDGSCLHIEINPAFSQLLLRYVNIRFGC